MFITNPEDVPFKNDVYHLAKTVRAAPLSQGPNMPWLPYSNNIEEENIMVPIVVYNSLACFLSEGSEGEEKKEKVWSWNFQDQVLDMEMRLAENLLEGKEHDVILQKVVSLNAFSIFRWDNTDLLEETLSGG
ncbi:hypothetical protein pdam_00021965, partial [Pocillopora damicornis]